MAIGITDDLDDEADHTALSVQARAGGGIQASTWWTVDVGRLGCAHVGVDDPTCPGLVFQVTAQDDDWAIAVPSRITLEVLVQPGNPTTTGTPVAGDERFTAPTATVSFMTDNAEHFFDIVWFGEPVSTTARRQVDRQAERLAGQTERELVELSVEVGHHRAIIVACRDRLQKVGAPALSSRELAEVLQLRTANPTEAAKQRVTRAVQELCLIKHGAFPNELPSGVRFGRDEAVEFLVRTGQVDAALVERALAVEADNQGDG